MPNHRVSNVNKRYKRILNKLYTMKFCCKMLDFVWMLISYVAHMYPQYVKSNMHVNYRITTLTSTSKCLTKRFSTNQYVRYVKSAIPLETLSPLFQYMSIALAGYLRKGNPFCPITTRHHVIVIFRVNIHVCNCSIVIISNRNHRSPNFIIARPTAYSNY